MVSVENKLDDVLFGHLRQLTGENVLQVNQVLHVFLSPILVKNLSLVIISYRISPWFSALFILSSREVNPIPVFLSNFLYFRIRDELTLPGFIAWNSCTRHDNFKLLLLIKLSVKN